MNYYDEAIKMCKDMVKIFTESGETEARDQYQKELEQWETLKRENQKRMEEKRKEYQKYDEEMKKDPMYINRFKY